MEGRRKAHTKNRHAEGCNKNLENELQIIKNQDACHAKVS